MTLRLRALALVALLPIVGCSATSDESTGVPNVPEMASSEVTAALSDGTVTYDEYESAYRNFVACMNDGGFEVIEHDPDANGVINYSVSNDAVAAGWTRRVTTNTTAPSIRHSRLHTKIRAHRRSSSARACASTGSNRPTPWKGC